MEHSDPHRLPTGIAPSNYRLRLAPDIGAARFGGQVTITAEATEAVSAIVMNATELTIETATVTNEGRAVEVTGIELHDEYERVVLRLAEPLALGAVVIDMTFDGVLNDKLHGFYRSHYTDADGREETLATTQFESTSARRAFPCWDEPALKATFDVTLVVEASLLAISCQSEVASIDLDDGRRAVTFATTPALSTYLLAFVVGNLEATEAVMAGGVPLRIIHTPGKGHMTAFAMDAGRFALDWLSDYFGIPYPGDKCDLIAIPDFAFGAMENLGCVTFREILLLVDPETTTQPEQQHAVDVIAHELAHMWFGDLVTMEWWNGLWLKEAFATFMEMLVTDAYRPEWNRWVDFGLSRTNAFDVDSLASTRPIEFEVHSPDDAESMYDVLTYEKGAAVVRMLQQYLGEEEFRAGVTNYLKTHAFGNTETFQLWDAIEESTGQPVRRIMDTWIYQGGYPLVSVTLGGERTLELAQTQFRFQGTTNAIWDIPIVISCGRDGERADTRTLFDSRSASVGPDDPPDWVLVNTAANGFYRVAYSPLLLDGILNNLDHLAPIERYGLIDDVWARLVAGDADATDVVSMLDRFGDETDLSVWQRIMGVLASLDRLSPDAARPRVAALTRRLLQPVFTRLGVQPVPDEPERTNELRAGLLRSLGTTGGDPDAITLARALNEDPTADPSLRDAALGVVARHGSDADFAEVRRRYRAASTPQDERRNMYALALFPDAGHIDTLLGMTINREVRIQDGPYLIAATMRNLAHGPRAWRFVTDNWAKLNELFPSNSIPRMLEGIQWLSYPELADEIFAFIAATPMPQSEVTIEQHMERLRVNVELRDRLGTEIIRALDG